MPSPFRQPIPQRRAVQIEERPSVLEYIKAFCFYVPEETNPFEVAGRGVVFCLLVYLGFQQIFHSVASNYATESNLHLINLPFHEAGHIIFGFFGKFIGTLGGSLMQVLMPTIVLGTFLLKTRDPFGGSVALWWIGENFIDLAPYINDARDLNLILLGGVTGKDVEDYHDWEYLLRKTGLLEWDHFLGTSAHVFGSLVMLTALAWGGYILYRQYQNRSA